MKSENNRIIIFHLIYWVLAYSIYVIFAYLFTHRYNEFLPADRKAVFSQFFLWGVMAGLFTGFILGFVDIYTNRFIKIKRSFRFIIFTKSALYITTFILGVIGAVFIILVVEQTTFYNAVKHLTVFNIPTYLFFIIASILVTFISQINKKFGPGVTLPMFLGKYYHPKVEARIIMFLDLKSSTSYAEGLGHVKYSELIQDCFFDLNRLVPEYKAEIYQYVGDGVVLTWKIDTGLDNLNCIKLFYSFKEVIEYKSDYYADKYGLVPEFKAGLNAGSVTVAEVGDIKREIAFHGDVLNTASRIQNLCNSYSKSLLISENLEANLILSDEFQKKFIDDVSIRGRINDLRIYSVEKA